MSSARFGGGVSQDQLHLTMKFESLSSRNLPSKIELEICDKGMFISI